MEEPIKGLSSKLQPTPAGQRAGKPLCTHTSKEPLLKVSFRQGELYVPSLSFEIAFWRLNLHPSFTNAFTKTCGPNDFLLWCQPLAHSLCNCLAPPHHPQVGVWKRATEQCLFLRVSLKPEQDTCSPLHKAGHRTGRAGRVWRILGKQWINSGSCERPAFPLNSCADSAILRFRNSWRMENE